jgi:uncharacterized membrane protein YjfL (UPF0719 family)
MLQFVVGWAVLAIVVTLLVLVFLGIVRLLLAAMDEEMGDEFVGGESASQMEQAPRTEWW